MNCFVSDATILSNKKDLEEAKLQAPNGVGTFTQAEYQALYKKKIVSLSCIHPDSGEVVPFFARTSAFVVMNIPIIGAMMLSAPTPFNTIFWQWFNQTYNAGFNYGNRNASSETNVTQIVQSYTLAVVSSITCAMAIRKASVLVIGTEATGLAVTVANSVVNYSAICVSSGLNVFFIRSGEKETGISVLDPDTMEEVGKSKTAAAMGI